MNTPLLSTHHLGVQAELLAVYRFTEAGRRVARPFIVCAYDLLVDGGDAIFRVQVKQAHRTADEKWWRVSLTKDRTKPVPSNLWDYCCAICTPNEAYVIPVQALYQPNDPSKLLASIALDPDATRFGAYRDRFGLGSGVERPCAELLPSTPARARWDMPRVKGALAYKRLSREQIREICKLPIRWFKHQQGEGLIPVEQVAQQFGVHVATLRNHLRGVRKDLQEPPA